MIDWNEIVSLYESGNSLRDIAEKQNVCYTKIHRYLVKNSLIRKRNKDITYEDVVILKNKGLSLRDIAKQLNTTHPTISKILKTPAKANYLNSDLLKWIISHDQSFKSCEHGIYSSVKDYFISIVEFKQELPKNHIRDMIKNKSLIFFEDEWTARQQQVKEFILSKLGIYDKQIYARKCQINIVDNKEVTKFISKNHIQKTNNPGYANIGLFYNQELVGLCQLRKHHRNSKDITISRMCFEERIQIVGGFSRLVKHAMKYCEANGFDKLITWSDNRLTDGAAYAQAGFTLDEKLKPDYSYIHPQHPHKRFSKQSMKKSNINCPQEYTEKQWTEHLGYRRVWDAGKTRFVYNIV